MANALEQLKQYTTVVADTGDIKSKSACSCVLGGRYMYIDGKDGGGIHNYIYILLVRGEEGGRI